METNLNKVKADIIGGREIDVIEGSINNFPLHNCIYMLANLMAYLLESDSNNHPYAMLPSECRTIRKAVNVCKEEFEFCIEEENNDLPRGIYEYEYKISLPSPKEVARVRNPKVHRTLVEVIQLSRLMLSFASSKTQNYITPEDGESCKLRFNHLDKVLNRYVGEGKSSKDTGTVHMPDYSLLGDIVPSWNADYSQMIEPSKVKPQSTYPDAPDSPSESKDKKK